MKMIMKFNVLKIINPNTVKIAAIPKSIIRVISDLSRSFFSKKKKITNIVWWIIQIRPIKKSTTFIANYFLLLILTKPLNLNTIVTVFMIKNNFEFKRRDMKGMKNKSSIEKAY